MLRRSLVAFRRRPLRFSCLAVGSLVLLWLVLSWFSVYLLTRRAHAPFAEPAPTVAWGRIESQRLATEDGQEIGAWFVAGPDEGPSVLLLHGNGDSRRKSLPLAEFFARRGCSVLAVSLRGHGDSTGDVNDIGYGARHDVLAAVGYLERRRPGRPVVVQGTSLGAAAATYAARDLGTRVSGYILESAYRDLRTAVRNRTDDYLGGFLGEVAYAGLALTGPLVLPDLDDMAPVRAIRAIPRSVPVLVLAGARDRHARPEEARALYQAVTSHGRLVWFAGAGHESLYANDRALYREVVGNLIAEVGSSADRFMGPRWASAKR